MATASVMLALAAGEGLARLLPRPYYDWNHRYGYYALHAIQQHADYWSYTPQTMIRNATVYAFPCQPPILQYDVRFRANNLGLVQARDFNPAKEGIAVFGDSFTEGQGSPPWFMDLERDADAILPAGWQLLNFGLQGWGVPNWANIAQQHGEEWRIRKAVFILIGEDWRRGEARWNEDDLRCFADETQCPGERWYSVPYDAPVQYLLDETVPRSAARHGDHWRACTSGFLQQHSRLYRLYVHIRQMRSTDLAAVRQARIEVHARNSNMIAAVLDRIGRENTAFVVLPERYEADRGRLTPATEEVLAELEKIGARHVSTCMLQGNDFMQWDGHPNAAGYAKIRACATQALRQLF